MAQVVSKARLGEDEDYNLSGERYKDKLAIDRKWPMVGLGDVCTIISGQSPEGKYYNQIGEGTPFYQGKTEFSERFLGSPTKWTLQETKIAEPSDILMSVRAPVGPVNITNQRICIGRGLAAIRPAKDIALRDYIFYMLDHIKDEINGNSGSTFASINHKDIENIQIPLPPLEVQQAIVDEIEGYQKIIDGARQVVENYKPVIKVDPSWPMVKLGDVCEVKGGKRIPKGMTYSNQETSHPYLRVVDFEDNSISVDNLKFISEDVFMQINRYTITLEDVFISIAGTIGLVGTIPERLNGANLTENAAKLIIKDKKKINKNYLVSCLASFFIQEQIKKLTHAVGVPKLSLERIKSIEIPIPSIAKQKMIIESLEEEKSFN